MLAFTAGRHYKHIKTNDNNKGDNHDQRETLGIQSTSRRRESIPATRQTIRQGNNKRTIKRREHAMQTLIELGQIARPIIIIVMAIGTLLSLPVLLSLADTDKDD